MNDILDSIAIISNFYWSYIGWSLIIVTGIYLTIVSKAFQFKALFNFTKNIKEIYQQADNSSDGIHPFKLYFSSVGGMVGLGNIVGISSAIMIGGPGSIFWTIIASIFGMLLKYAEIFLGIKYRVQNSKGGFNGGPMYYLQVAFKKKWVAYLAAALICLYGVETYQFVILVDRIETSLNLDRNLVIALLLSAITYSSMGGIKRLSNICVFLMPIFMLSYIFLSLYVIFSNVDILWEFCEEVMMCAFTDKAQVGGFAGASFILAAYMGISKSVYSGDICIGYDSIVQSETRISNPQTQATLAIYALFTDSIICVLTNFVLGINGAWYKYNHLQPSDIVAKTLAEYFVHSEIFVTLLLFFAGFTTLIAYLAAGVKCAKFINMRYGKVTYFAYAIFAFVFFCSFKQDQLMIIMEMLSGILVLINISAIIKLRRDIKFNQKANK